MKIVRWSEPSRNTSMPMPTIQLVSESPPSHTTALFKRIRSINHCHLVHHHNHTVFCFGLSITVFCFVSTIITVFDESIMVCACCFLMSCHKQRHGPCCVFAINNRHREWASRMVIENDDREWSSRNIVEHGHRQWAWYETWLPEQISSPAPSPSASPS